MIIVKIWGGIGNQLFQYVFGQYLRHRFHQDVRYDDNSFVSTDKLRKRELDALNVNIDWDDHCSFSKYKGVKGRILRLYYQMFPKQHYIGLDDKIPDRIKSTDVYFFQGYWQDYKYYEWLQNNIPDFIIKSKIFPIELDDIKQKIVACPQSVSIHIRRGDYFTPQYVSTYGVCTKDYFEKAIKIMKEKIPNARFFVFTDDIDWVNDHIQLDADALIIPNYDISQFAYIELMSLCKHHIISNSSFSWWGAILNEKKDSLVISPSKWKLTSDKTIALDKWIKI